MANTNTFELASLDPDTLKNSLKEFMRAQDIFRDYDFDGSNLNQLLTILAHNTFKNGWYLNMNMAESFLDSAQLKPSVISRAKELNYTPRSARSAKAIVTLQFQTDANTNYLVVPKGTGFTTVVGQKTFTFSTAENIRLYPRTSNSTVNEYISSNIEVYEGIYVQDNYIMDYSADSQIFKMSNKNVDTESVVVISYEDNNSVTVPYLEATTLLGLRSDSKSYFIEQGLDEKYTVLFGDDLIGRRPKDRSIINIEYRVSSGEGPNGANKFVIDTDITDGNLVDEIIVTTVQSARGGAVPETVSSVKYYAPRHFQIQERAVVNTDYEILLQRQFPEISSVSVYGGDEVHPPQFGKVFVAVDIAGLEGFPGSKREEYSDFLRTRMPMSITPEMVDPEFVYYSVSSVVRFNPNITVINPEDIKTIVLQAILDWNEETLNDFNVTLRYSRFVNMIDNAHDSIVSNETEILVYKKLVPERLGVAQNFNLNFRMALHDHNTTSATLQHQIVYSSPFTYDNTSVHFADDGEGNICLFNDQNGMVLTNCGAVNYSTGIVSLTNIRVDGYSGDGIYMYVLPAEKDIVAAQRDILTVEPSQIDLTVVEARE